MHIQADSLTDDFNKEVKVEWKELAPLPVGRTAHTAVLLHGSVYVGGGYEGKDTYERQSCYRLDVYNLTTNQWSTSPITTPYCHYAMTVLDDKLIIAGGETESGEVTNKILVLDHGRWKDYSDMPTARCCAAAVGYQSMIIIVGGKNGKWNKVANTELLDTTNGCWYTCDDLPVPHQQLKVYVMGNVLHLLSGNAVYFDPSPQVFTTSLDNLSSHQLKWQSLPDTPWCYSAPVVLYNKFLLTVGGRHPSDRTSQTTKVCAFDPSTGLWKQIANIPAARSLPSVVGVDDNKIIVLGGFTQQREYSNSAWFGVFK